MVFYFLYKYKNNFLFPKIKVHEQEGWSWWYSMGGEKSTLSTETKLKDRITARSGQFQLDNKKKESD